jgi:hypothetical protein
MSDCPRFGKLFGGCKFEARYDEPPLLSHLMGSGMYTTLKIDGKIASIDDVVPMKKYVRDVCVRCGKAIERTKPVA